MKCGKVVCVQAKTYDFEKCRDYFGVIFHFGRDDDRLRLEIAHEMREAFGTEYEVGERRQGRKCGLYRFPVRYECYGPPAKLGI